MKIAQVQQNNSQTFKALHLQKNISKELANKFIQMEPELSAITKDVELYFFNNNSRRGQSWREFAEFAMVNPKYDTPKKRARFEKINKSYRSQQKNEKFKNLLERFPLLKKLFADYVYPYKQGEFVQDQIDLSLVYAKKEYPLDYLNKLKKALFETAPETVK